MTPVKPNSYATSFRHLIPEGFSLQKESSDQLSSIIYEIHCNFIKACVKNNGDSITATDVQNSITDLIPTGLRRYAFAEGNKQVSEYKSGLLDFHIERPSSATDDARFSVFDQFIKEFARNEHSISLGKDSSKYLYSLLHCVLERVMEDSVHSMNMDSTKASTMTEDHIYNALRNNLPKRLFQYAVAQSQADVMNYRYGFLKYQRTRPKGTVTETIEEEKDKEIDFVPDFRRGIKNIAKDYEVSFGRGCLSAMNDSLVDVCKKLVEICSERVATPGFLQGRDAFRAVSELFPGQLQQHAIEEMSVLERELSLSVGQVESDVNPPEYENFMNLGQSFASAAGNEMVDSSIHKSISSGQSTQRYEDLQNNVEERRISEEHAHLDNNFPEGFSFGITSEKNGALSNKYMIKPSTHTHTAVFGSNVPFVGSSEGTIVEPGKSSEESAFELKKSSEETGFDLRKSISNILAHCVSLGDNFQPGKNELVHAPEKVLAQSGELKEYYRSVPEKVSHATDLQTGKSAEKITDHSEKSRKYTNILPETFSCQANLQSVKSLEESGIESKKFLKKHSADNFKDLEDETSTLPGSLQESGIYIGKAGKSEEVIFDKSEKSIENAAISRESNIQTGKASEQHIDESANHEENVLIESTEFPPRINFPDIVTPTENQILENCDTRIKKSSEATNLNSHIADAERNNQHETNEEKIDGEESDQ